MSFPVLVGYVGGIWYLWVILDVEAEEAAGLSCQVKHSSLASRTPFSTGVSKTGSVSVQR